MAWLDATTVTEEGTEPTCDQEHSTLEGNLLGNLKNGSQQSLGDAAALPVFAKRRFHAAQAISPHTAKATNQERQAGALRAKKPRQWRHKRPEACDPRVSAWSSFASPKVLG